MKSSKMTGALLAVVLLSKCIIPIGTYAYNCPDGSKGVLLGTYQVWEKLTGDQQTQDNTAIPWGPYQHDSFEVVGNVLYMTWVSERNEKYDWGLFTVNKYSCPTAIVYVYTSDTLEETEVRSEIGQKPHYTTHQAQVSQQETEPDEQPDEPEFGWVKKVSDIVVEGIVFKILWEVGKWALPYVLILI